jgi:molybdopterin-binding protein
VIGPLLNPREQARLIVFPEYASALAGLEEVDYASLVTLLDWVPERLPLEPGQLVQVPFMLQETGEAVGAAPRRSWLARRRPGQHPWRLVRRAGAPSRAALLAGRRSLERAGMLEPTPEESKDMELSARNQLKGVIRGVKTGQVMAEITVEVEAGSVVAAITDSSRERLNLQDGDQVTVFVKSTEVMIGK